MPFIEKVLKQVEPFMEKMVITLSEKSNDGTAAIVHRFKQEHPQKVILLTENVKEPAQLTEERNKQLVHSPSDWILFLDDDDYWPVSQLQKCLKFLDKDKDTLAYAVSSYHLLDTEHCDYRSLFKFYSKFLRNTEGLHYLRTWPRDMPADKNEIFLHWESHPKVKILPYKFYHLMELKNHSFRKHENWHKNKFYRVKYFSIPLLKKLSPL